MTDKELHDSVEEALIGDPRIDAPDIAVSVHDGVVTLRGDVKSYRQRAAAERLAFGIEGVRAVANDVNTYSPDRAPSGTEIAEAAVSALRRNTGVPDVGITLSVSDGWVTLNGAVNSDDERSAAGIAVGGVPGVRGVSNDLLRLAPVSW